MLARTHTVLLILIGASPLVAQQRPTPAPRPAYADSLPDATHWSIPATIAEAEAEGRSWPRRREPSTQFADKQRLDFDTPAARSCVTAVSIGPLRSGEFIIGGNIGGDAAWHGQVKIWWEPMHPADGFSLVVRGMSLTIPGDTLRFLKSGLAIGGSPPSTYLGPWFYTSGVVIPSVGRWLVIATSGPDWGCFILTSS